MTIAICPQGCGGVVDTDKDVWCPSCRRNLDEIQIPMPDWCWEWWGPPHHCMRCRLPLGHTGPHNTHEYRFGSESVIISVEGELITGNKS